MTWDAPRIWTLGERGDYGLDTQGNVVLIGPDEDAEKLYIAGSRVQKMINELARAHNRDVHLLEERERLSRQEKEIRRSKALQYVEALEKRLEQAEKRGNELYREVISLRLEWGTLPLDLSKWGQPPDPN